MESIANISFDFKKETARSNRSALLKELYQLYISQPDEKRKENIRRYHEWVRLHYPSVVKKAGFSKERYAQYKDEFKSAKLPKEQKFLKYFKETDYGWWSRFSHLKNDDLEFMVSRAKDILNRYERASKEDKGKYLVAAYILGSVKATSFPQSQ